MFCIACGRQMSDEDRFCSQCGSRRAVIPSDVEVASPPPPPARQEAPVAPPPAPARTIRSTAEIMPIRVQRPSAPPPTVQQTGGVETEEPEAAPPPVAQWPAPESAMPSLFTTPGPAPVSQREPVRYAPPPPPPVYEAAPPVEAPAPPPERYVSVPFAASPALPETTAERKRISPVLIGAFVVALIALGGIFWMLRSTMSGGSAAAAKVEITIYPTEAKVVAGKSADFAATVTGPPNSDVTWKVEEGDDGGQVQVQRGPQGANSLYSTYTAPKTPGVYHLVATSTADTTKSATADITVTAK